MGAFPQKRLKRAVFYHTVEMKRPITGHKQSMKRLIIHHVVWIGQPDDIAGPPKGDSAFFRHSLNAFRALSPPAQMVAGAGSGEGAF